MTPFQLPKLLKIILGNVVLEIFSSRPLEIIWLSTLILDIFVPKMAEMSSPYLSKLPSSPTNIDLRLQKITPMDLAAANQIPRTLTSQRSTPITNIVPRDHLPKLARMHFNMAVQHRDLKASVSPRVFLSECEVCFSYASKIR